MIKKTYYRHLPLKKFSQNFLINPNIIKDIIKHINPKKNEILVEIGPGLGALTGSICTMLDHLIVVEIDANLLKCLKNTVFFKKLTIFHQNALYFNYLKLFNEKKKIIRVFGNLPYNIATSLIINLFKQINFIQDMNFMLQKEVADRLIATPGNKAYGRLSVLAQYYCSIKFILEVSPQSFYPIPKVNSVFVNLIPYKKNPFFVYNIDVLSNITNVAFQQRRKILRHSLNSLFSIQQLTNLGIDPMLRAENISVPQYCKLANYLYMKKY